jgi:hypothetical protein
MRVFIEAVLAGNFERQDSARNGGEHLPTEGKRISTRKVTSSNHGPVLSE